MDASDTPRWALLWSNEGWELFDNQAPVGDEPRPKKLRKATVDELLSALAYESWLSETYGDGGLYGNECLEILYAELARRLP